MVAKVALGWDVGIAVNADTGVIPGRMFVSGAYYAFRNSDIGFPGYDGFSGGLQWRAGMDSWMAATISWMTNGKMPANILITGYVYYGNVFQSEFTNALTRIGHTWTYTGAFNWNGLNPLDYDVIFIDSPAGYQPPIVPSNPNYPDIDTILDANGKIFTIDIGGPGFSRYGYTASGFQSGTWYTGTPNTSIITPLPNNPQAYDPYQAVVFVPGVQTRPGTVSIWDNQFGEHSFWTWNA